ncbi:MAG: hypothetical protein ACRC9R_11475, partial [Enterovibrio sp.]
DSVVPLESCRVTISSLPTGSHSGASLSICVLENGSSVSKELLLRGDRLSIGEYDIESSSPGGADSFLQMLKCGVNIIHLDNSHLIVKNSNGSLLGFFSPMEDGPFGAT